MKVILFNWIGVYNFKENVIRCKSIFKYIDAMSLFVVARPDGKATRHGNNRNYINAFNSNVAYCFSATATIRSKNWEDCDGNIRSRWCGAFWLLQATAGTFYQKGCCILSLCCHIWIKVISHILV